MHIESIRIDNYKSFYSTSDIHFHSGFNIVIGKNDSGKTALVEALSSYFANKPHYSIKTIPIQGISLSNIVSQVELSISLTTEELREFLRPPQDLFIPVIDPENDEHKFYHAFSISPHIITVIFKSGDLQASYLRQYGPTPLNTDRFLHLRIDSRGQIERVTKGVTVGVNPENSFPTNLVGVLRDRIYAFKAERMSIGESGYGRDTVLMPDASNLAQVILNVLQSNPSALTRYNNLVNTVFPEIKQITVMPFGEDRVRVLVWGIDSNSERADLAIPLSDSGTGINTNALNKLTNR